jgi:hypothetical protein
MYTQKKIALSGTGEGLQVAKEISAVSASAVEKMGKYVVRRTETVSAAD